MTTTAYRYRVGCAGMFMLNMDYGVADEDEAIVACESGPPGCEVYDTIADRWIGPTNQFEIDAAKARIAQRTADREVSS
jgi:hypothetical protein